MKKHVDTSTGDEKERKLETMLDWQYSVWYEAVITQQQEWSEPDTSYVFVIF